jgi:hypothetical protein
MALFLQAIKKQSSISVNTGSIKKTYLLSSKHNALDFPCNDQPYLGYSLYRIIKRFTGNKKIVTEATKVISDNTSHSPKPPHISSNSVPSSPSIMPKTIPVSRLPSPEKTFSNETNKIHLTFATKFDSATEKVINYNNVKQTQEKKLIIPEAVIKKGNTYYNITSNKTDILVKTQEEHISSDNILIGVTLNNNNLPEERTPPQKHVNFGIINTENRVEVFGYATSSAGHSRDKADHGTPKNLKLSNEKMDGSFVPEYHVEKKITISDTGPDFVSVITKSETKGGQYFASQQNIINVHPGDYSVSELGTDYIHNNPEIETKLQDEYTKIKSSNKTPIDYDPKIKKDDEETDS